MSGNDDPAAFALPEIFAGIGFIDSHHHFWQLGRFPYRWLGSSAPPARFGDKTAIRRDYLTPDYLEDMAGLPLLGSVHVQANCGASDPVEETRWLQELSDETGWPAAVVAEVDLVDPRAPEIIDRHAKFPLLKGFRTPVAWDEEGRWRIAANPDALSDKAFNEAAADIAARKLALEMVVVPAQIVEVEEFARTHPTLKILLNHFATLEPSRAGNAETWRRGIETLGSIGNVHVKLSGLWTVDKTWEAAILRPFVVHLLDTIGADRVMWGSNLPVEGVNCPLPRQIEQLAVILSDRSEDELSFVFARTAGWFYGLEVGDRRSP